MALTYDSNEYQIPRGKVFFDPYDANDALTGERYLGNCPGVTVSIESSKAEHYSSEGGLREKDASITVEINRTGTLNCDNISATNLALFLSGTEETITQTLNAAASDDTITALQGRYYQIGQTSSNPAGDRNIASVVVKDATDTTTFVAGTDYNVDLDLGRIQIIEGGAIDNEVIHIDYARTAETWTRVKTGSTAELYGALRVVADNASGDNRDFYMPYVSLTPSGELPIIQDGTEFVAMSFNLEVLKPANAEAIYVDGRPV